MVPLDRIHAHPHQFTRLATLEPQDQNPILLHVNILSCTFPSINKFWINIWQISKFDPHIVMLIATTVHGVKNKALLTSSYFEVFSVSKIAV
jgi:hypothetical protein